ncbi:MAG: AraC family transcriptional regulator [Bacteroidetes bacterium]|nr:AraC family transcriptional regulator [Bacteroidota bacterium]
MEKLISTVVWAAIIQGLFLVVIYFFSKNHQSFANRLLGLFLFVIVYEAVYTFLPIDYFGGYSLGEYFSLPEVKIFFPLLFLHYILEKVGRSGRYRILLRIHYVLAFAFIGVTFFNIFLFLTKGVQIMEFLGESTAEFIFINLQNYTVLLAIVSLIISIKELKRYKNVVLKEYSDYDMLNINWLWQFILIMIPMVALWGAEMIWIFLGGGGNSPITSALWGVVIIFIYFVSYQAFKHKNLFDGISDTSEAIDDSIKQETIQEFSDPIIGKEDKTKIQKIQQHMETHEPYLDPSLSVHQLAKQLNMSVRELSILFNHKLDRHFFDFVNEYRINKAMEILRDPKKKDMTILEILYQVGFNSKSSFNTIFKKRTGETPTEFRRNYSLSAA